jgi:hypothetical protein
MYTWKGTVVACVKALSCRWPANSEALRTARQAIIEVTPASFARLCVVRGSVCARLVKATWIVLALGVSFSENRSPE